MYEREVQMTKKKIAFIPIDNRPVCYELAQDIAAIDGDIELLLPPKWLLGDLKKNSRIDGIYSWVESLNEVDYLVVSLDTIAYGGLIPSRRSSETLTEIKNRVEKFIDLFKSKNAKILAVSSIMRISNNNINEEEKEYWSKYGKKIFKYSWDLSKDGEAQTDVPSEIIEDYILTRKRNFEINCCYIEYAQSGIFDTLVLSKDDCAEFGLNIQECRKFEAIIKEKELKNVLLKTGADEIPLSLLSRIITGGRTLKIAPVYTNPDGKNKISKYEDVSVAESVKGQILLAGARPAAPEEADIILFVNNFKDIQGELVMGVEVEGFGEEFDLPEKPFLIADILNANGADNDFVNTLTDKDFYGENFLGYAAWNTTGNTLGSGLCCALAKYCAKDFNENAFKKVQTVRFLDDWAYQANLRKYLKNTVKKPDEAELKRVMKPFEKLVARKLGTKFKEISYSFPWERFFEVSVNVS